MTFEEKMAAIDRYFDNISSEDFNKILEEKYGIPMNADVEEGAVASNDACDLNDHRYSLGQNWRTPLMREALPECTENDENDFSYEDAA